MNQPNLSFILCVCSASRLSELKRLHLLSSAGLGRRLYIRTLTDRRPEISGISQQKTSTLKVEKGPLPIMQKVGPPVGTYYQAL